MTRQELIQIIERKVAEQEQELSIDRHALAVLRGKSELRKGPIVYGNGHHDGKRPNNHGGARDHKNPLVPEVRKVLLQALTKNPRGLTTAQMRFALDNAGIQIGSDTNPIHNALRRIPGVISTGPSNKPRSGGKVYSLKGETK